MPSRYVHRSAGSRLAARQSAGRRLAQGLLRLLLVRRPILLSVVWAVTLSWACTAPDAADPDAVPSASEVGGSPLGVGAVGDAGPAPDVPISCAPREWFCSDEATSQLCNSTGNGVQKTSECLEDYVCAPQTGKCVPWQCEPGQTGCVAGDRLRGCEAPGFWLQAVPCPGQGGCADGACTVCPPDVVRCLDGHTLARCVADGSEWVVEGCGAHEVCQDSPVGVTCVPESCPLGASECLSEVWVRSCPEGKGWQQAACGAEQRCVAGACSPCTIAGRACDAEGQAAVCDGSGEIVAAEACVEGERCGPSVGVCLPETCVEGERRCEASAVVECEAGTWRLVERCDGEQGLSCDPDAPRCEGPCASDVLDGSTLGCDFRAMALPGDLPASGFGLGVVVVNPHEELAGVVVTRGDFEARFEVGPRGAERIVLPMDERLSQVRGWAGSSAVVRMGGSSRRVIAGAYRVRTTRPVTALQMQPVALQGPQGGAPAEAFQGDMSLLLPVAGWPERVAVVTQKTLRIQVGGTHYDSRGCYATVTAERGAQLMVTVPGLDSHAPAGGEVLTPGVPEAVEPGDVMLAFSDFIHVERDVSGNVVTGRAQVLSCHPATREPRNADGWDHLQEVNLPPGCHYVVARQETPAGTLAPRAIRVRRGDGAYFQGAELTLWPPLENENLVTSGRIIAPQHDAALRLAVPGHAGQVSYGSGVVSVGVGDPSLTMAVPMSRWLESYAFYSPDEYESFVIVAAREDVAVTVDGVVVDDRQPLGSSGYWVARVALEVTADGAHFASGDGPFEVQVYGFGFERSFWYPAGADLRPLDRLVKLGTDGSCPSRLR